MDPLWIIVGAVATVAGLAIMWSITEDHNNDLAKLSMRLDQAGIINIQYRNALERVTTHSIINYVPESEHTTFISHVAGVAPRDGVDLKKFLEAAVRDY